METLSVSYAERTTITIEPCVDRILEHLYTTFPVQRGVTIPMSAYDLRGALRNISMAEFQKLIDFILGGPQRNKFRLIKWEHRSGEIKYQIVSTEWYHG